jgi:outer membrane protein assembly factor BamB
VTRARLLLAAAALAAVGVGSPAWSTPPACNPSSTGDRCPTRQFDYETETAIPSAAAVDHTRQIAVAAGQDQRRATAVAFDAKTSRQRWVQQLPVPGATSDTVLLDVAVHERTGRTFFGGYGFVDNQRTVATVHAVDTATGRLLWTAAEPVGVNFIDNVTRVQPSPDGKIVYALGERSIPSSDGGQHYAWRVTAHDAATGQIRWSWTLGGVVQALVNDAALSADGTTLLVTGYVYTEQDHWQVTALDTGRGTPRWTYRSRPHSTYSALAVDSTRGLVAIVANRQDNAEPGRIESSVRRLATGRVVWTTDLTTPSAWTLVNDVTFLGNRVVVAGYTVAADAPLLPVQDRETRPVVAAFGPQGGLLWRSSPPAPAGSATATGLTNSGGRLFAYGEQDDRALVQPTSPSGSAIVWRIDDTTGQTTWTGTTRGIGDGPHADLGERVVGAVPDGDGVLVLVRHADPDTTGVGSPHSYLFQHWAT